MSAIWSKDSLEAYNSPANRGSEGLLEKSVFFSALKDKIPWLLSCLTILIMIGYIFISDAGLVKSNGLLEKKTQLELENLRLEEENRQLAIRLERILTDFGYLEDEARNKLGLVKPNEIIYKLAEESEFSDQELKNQSD
ncbi:MAG: septum formation initiator family protein [Clostridiales Family XIII bacterium]|jgi:cell division protein FtsB|nr:septum formation initiator family protein [Clostridiales Family XIII bacterium]